MNNTLRILFLEDSIEDYELIVNVLKRSGMNLTSKRVDSRAEFIEALDAFNADIILSDHSLPQFNSTEALKYTRERGNDVPFILVTGAVSDEFAVKTIKLGADDYVLKSNLARLPNAIDNALKQRAVQQSRMHAVKELARRNEELSKINKELDSFVYSVSHNLRAPLMSVLGLISLARTEKDPAALEQYHEMMESTVHKLDATLREILEYARNARQEIVIEEIDLENVIADNFEKMAFMPDSAKLKKEIIINQTHPLYADKYRLSVIFNNLISNSIKYMDRTKPEGLIRITATVNEAKCMIEFEDNGIGIDPQLLPKVFNMFFRATEKKEGAGLGLYIVKEAVDILKGTVRIESSYGYGTKFLIELPNATPPEHVMLAEPEHIQKT